MKSVLITGVAGMIGSHLLDELLARSYEVVGLDNLTFGKMENIEHNLKNKRFKFYKSDVLDSNELQKISKGIGIIVHLASLKKLSEKDSSFKDLIVNTKGTDNVFEVAKMNGAKVIFASTSDVYGMSDDLPFREDGDLLIGPPTAKRWAYAVSKLYGEQLAFAFYKEYNVPTVILRYFGAFSPRSNPSWSGGHIPIFLEAILNNREVIIHGDGKQTRSMGYIDDSIQGTILAIENTKAIGEIFNIGNDEEMSIIDSAYLIHKIANTGNRLKLKFIPYKNKFGTYKDIKRRVPDLSKAKKILKFTPKISFEEGLRRTIEWQKSLK